ncbi:transmembrane protein 6/97 [Microdochium trichocladiopsis]|uniref:Efficient mitochondria targeting-associated protein 19 n=1 Tax=Microdochium trichocladiopsis TaxID=1682393 RepID=A0A9P8Y5M7_9PEZI|nr:transmembrane protein 6/97 [Microdochium trichocladiopsis]KAH7031657.1 transmembrane protein 6/97 [Microdochium trichocladiopsis]
MAPSSTTTPPTSSWLDKVYLVYFAIHIPVMLCVDLVPLYPHSLWVPASAPLHFLHDLRAWYLATYADQFFAAPPAVAPAFFTFFTLLELVFHFPVSVWAVRRLGGKQLDGAAELVLLVYGIETVLTTACCMFEAYHWDAALVTSEQRVMLLTALYGSYLAVATLLSVDMYARLLNRVSPSSAGHIAKKLQ